MTKEKRNLIEFDTNDKKPKLYNLGILSAVVLTIVIILSSIGGSGNIIASGAIMCVYAIAAIAILLDALVKQIRYNPYSYNTIYYIGFALFTLAVLISYITVTVRFVNDPMDYHRNDVLTILLGSAKTYMLFSFPFIFLFSLALCISNICLIRYEGRRLVNILGIILSILLLGGEIFLYKADFYAMGSRTQVMIHDLLTNTFAAVYLYFECMLIGTIIANIIVVRYEPKKDKDYLIILGCGIRGDGTPTPLLRGRIDRALKFYKAQKEETGKELTFITSGGQGADEVISESESMKRCLIENGVDPERIIEEDRSTDTLENMRFSKEKIGEITKDTKIAFSTTNYHVFRSGLCARRVKMRAVGMGAKTKWYFWPNAAVREFVGLLTEHRVKQSIILGSLIVVYIVMTLVFYLGA